MGSGGKDGAPTGADSGDARWYQQTSRTSEEAEQWRAGRGEETRVDHGEKVARLQSLHNLKGSQLLRGGTSTKEAGTATDICGGCEEGDKSDRPEVLEPVQQQELQGGDPCQGCPHPNLPRTTSGG